MRTPEQIVQAEVLCCMSSIVAALANRPDDGPRLRSAAGDDLADLCWQAIELAAPIDDWESAAREAGAVLRKIGGWRFDDGRDGVYLTAQELCDANDIDPHQTEVFEHWAVTDWFADQLLEHGEKVDKDFGGLCVWARTTTGQAIASDYVLEQIAADLNRA